MPNARLAQRVALLAGLLDFSTGLGLAFLPAFTLRCMLVPAPGAEAEVYVRFIGAFVAAVGASYLWALRRPVERLRVVFGATVFFRLAAGLFTGSAVVLAALAPAWLIVTTTDFALAAAQVWFLRRPD